MALCSSGRGRNGEPPRQEQQASNCGSGHQGTLGEWIYWVGLWRPIPRTVETGLPPSRAPSCVRRRRRAPPTGPCPRSSSRLSSPPRALFPPFFFLSGETSSLPLFQTGGLVVPESWIDCSSSQFYCSVSVLHCSATERRLFQMERQHPTLPNECGCQ
jgi:hypothetical protein